MKNTDSNQATQPSASPEYMTVRIDPKLYMALKMYFKQSKEYQHLVHSHEIMEVICREFLENHAPQILALLDEEYEKED